jgi:hypothetical protein
VPFSRERCGERVEREGGGVRGSGQQIERVVHSTERLSLEERQHRRGGDGGGGAERVGHDATLIIGIVQQQHPVIYH